MKTFIQKVLVVMLATFIMSLLVKGIIQVGDTTIYQNDIQVLYDLDYPQTQLNNHTLREVFEGGQLLPNGNFNNGTTGLTDSGSITKSVTNGILSLVRVTASTGTYFTVTLVNGNKYYINGRLKANSTEPRFRIGTTPLSSAGGLSFTPIVTYNNYSGVMTSTSTTHYISWLFGSTSNLGDTIDSDYALLYDLTVLGISSLTVQQMDYWFNIYQTLNALEVQP